MTKKFRQTTDMVLVVTLFIGVGTKSGAVHGATVTESFETRSHLDLTGGMVWNTALGVLHPPIRAEAWENHLGGGPQTLGIDVGDGHHGAFVESRYSLFDQNGLITGGEIELDTDQFPELELTEFDLKAGYTLKPVGQSPLVIRVLSSMRISGLIDCSGEAGGDSTANISETIAGGVGRCGGANGGASTAAGVSPAGINQGGSGGAGTTGGSGGPICLASGGQGGGGGGSFVKSFVGGLDKPNPTDGNDSLGGVGGAVGTIFRDDSFNVVEEGSGSGGGGGSAFDHAGDPGHHSSGAGGGAGGGNIRIYAVGDISIDATGAVNANGGYGGSVAAGKGGAGGGAGGGSILMFSAGDIQLDGPVTAAAGLGGTSAGGSGGNGAWGRTWILEKDGYADYTVIEDPETNLNVPGAITYETNVPYTVLSGAIDLGNTGPTLINLPLQVIDLASATTLNYELAFADTNDLMQLSSFAPSASYLNTEQKRFARFRFDIENSSSTNPVMIASLGFTYTGRIENNFEFTSSCGSIRENRHGSVLPADSSPKVGALCTLLILSLPLMVLALLRFRKNSSVAKSRSI